MNTVPTITVNNMTSRSGNNNVNPVFPTTGISTFSVKAADSDHLKRALEQVKEKRREPYTMDDTSQEMLISYLDEVTK